MRIGRIVAALAGVSLVLGAGVYGFAASVHGTEDEPCTLEPVGQMTSRFPVISPQNGRLASMELQSPGSGGTWAKALPGYDRHVAFMDGTGPQIGVSVRDVEPSDVTRQKLPNPTGAVVDEVRSETPAAKAGVKAGDVVVAFDGEQVRSARQLERLVDETPTGRTVKMTVLRDGSRIDLDITPDTLAAASGLEQLAPRLAERLHRFDVRPRAGGNGEFRFSAPPVEFDFDDGPLAARFSPGRLGVRIDTVDGQLADYFGVSRGVLVREVIADSPAAKAGLKAGDVITAVNAVPTEDSEDLRRALNDIEDGKPVTLAVTRDHKTQTITATLDVPKSTRARVRRIV